MCGKKRCVFCIGGCVRGVWKEERCEEEKVKSKAGERRWQEKRRGCGEEGDGLMI